MNYQEYTPSLHLMPFIEKFWTLISDVSDIYPIEQIITPNGVEALLITFPPVVRRFIIDDKSTVLPEVLLFLQPHAPWKLVTEGNSVTIGVFFRAGSINTFLRSSLINIVGQLMELQAFGGSKPVRMLRERIINAIPFQRISILEEFFTNHFYSQKIHQSNTAFAVHLIQKHGGLMPVKLIATELGISRPALSRQFSEKVGVSPKQYSRLIHFNTAQQFLKKHPRVSWLELTCKFNYFDQSHLSKDFYHFTGTSPKGYIALDTFLVNSLVRTNIERNFL